MTRLCTMHVNFISESLSVPNELEESSRNVPRITLKQLCHCMRSNSIKFKQLKYFKITDNVDCQLVKVYRLHYFNEASCSRSQHLTLHFAAKLTAQPGSCEWIYEP